MQIQKFLDNRIKVENKFKSVGIKRCGVCNKELECFDAIKKTFTNLDELKSQYICKDCMNLFSDEWRKTAFYITKNICKKLKQAGFEDLLFKQKIEFPCLISFSESRKKHRLFRTKLSYNLKNVYLNVDNGEVTLDVTQDSLETQIFKLLSEYYNNYKISKSWFLDFPTNAIQKTIGLQKYLNLQKLIKPIKNSYKYNLLIMFLNKWQQKNLNENGKEKNSIKKKKELKKDTAQQQIC